MPSRMISLIVNAEFMDYFFGCSHVVITLKREWMQAIL